MKGIIPNPEPTTLGIMNILKCYKILELDHGSSMDEAREAYIDMARVWHPDRFTNNPRLRKKAEEKLKEINIAYSEIRALFPAEPEILQTKKVNRNTQGTLEAINRNILAVKEFTRNLCSRAYSILREADLKQISRQLLSPKIDLGSISNQRSRNNDSISREAGYISKGRDRHRNFADIYEEVARAKKKEKRKMRKMR